MWVYILSICALSPLSFIIYTIVSYLKNKEYRPSMREVLLVAGVTIATAVVLYVVDVFFFYIRFYADYSTRHLIVVLIGLIGLGWLVYQLIKTKKQ